MVISLTLENVCANGGHATIGISVDGGTKKLVTYDVDDIRGPIEDRDQLIAHIVRLSTTGLTRAQARTKLQAGITITL